MPLIRVDIPHGHDRETKQALYDAIHDGIFATWATDHIYISLRERFAPAGDRQVLFTFDLRPGRDDEAGRLDRLFDAVQPAFENALGTRREDFILLVRHFPAEACLPGGTVPNPLARLTPGVKAAE